MGIDKIVLCELCIGKVGGSLFITQQHMQQFVVSIIKENDSKVTSVISVKSLIICFNYRSKAQLRVTLSCSEENEYRGPIERNKHKFYKSNTYSRIENYNF